MLILGRAMVDTSFTSPLRTRWPRPPIVLDQPAPHRPCRPQRAQLELQTLVPPRTARAQPRRQLPIRRPVPRPAGWIPLLISHTHRACSATRSASTSYATPASLSSSAGRHWATRPRPIRPSARGAPVQGRARRSPDWATRSEPHRPEDPECGRVRSCPLGAGTELGPVPTERPAAGETAPPAARKPPDRPERPTRRTPAVSSRRRCRARVDRRRCAGRPRMPGAPSRCSAGSRAGGYGCRASRPSARTGG